VEGAAARAAQQPHVADHGRRHDDPGRLLRRCRARADIRLARHGPARDLCAHEPRLSDPHRLRALHGTARAHLQPDRRPLLHDHRPESEDCTMIKRPSLLPTSAVNLASIGQATSPDKLALRRFLRNPIAVIGVIALLITVIASVLAPVISPYAPTAIDLANVRQPPSAEHLLGTDSTGRDVLSRLLAGGQISLMVGFLAALMAVVIGTLAGVVAGWFGGIVDAIISRIIDIMLSVPAVLVIIVLAGVIGPSVPMLIVVIAGLAWPSPARIARSVVLSLREEEFVQAARAF